MAIEYVVEDNALTTPPSYNARAVPKNILDTAELSYQINLHNPTIPVETARSVLEAFRAECLIQIPAGNTIKMTGFISIVATLKGKMDTPASPLPTNPLDIVAKVSKPLKEEIRNAASYYRLPHTTKTPQILLAYDTVTDIENYVRDGYGLEVNGSNMNFDKTDTDQGIFLLSEAGNNIRQANTSLINPSKLIFVPALDPAVQPAGTHSVEQTLSIVTKYTSGGQLRTGTYNRKLRTTNVISDAAGDDLFVTGGAATGPASVGAYAGAQVDCIIVAKIDTFGQLTLSVGAIDGEQGQSLDVDVEGDYVLTGLAADVTVTVSDYDALYAAVESYTKYMKEVCDLSPLTP